MHRDNVISTDVLLHSCCGPCSTAVIERLAPDFNITVFFYNPCITDRHEYEKRKENQKKLIRLLNGNPEEGKKPIGFIEGDYDVGNYFERIKGLEGEPEGGKRCAVCFEQRIGRTAEYAAKNGFGIFATTLTVSPHKDYKLITEIGKKFAAEYDIQFLDRDFKKKAGFQRSVELSKEYGLYRQDYCGCGFSAR